MSREAFEVAMAALPPEQRYGLGAQLAWPIWQAARAAALEEAAEVCERIGPAMAERYGPCAECITTSDECAAAIRALKEKQ